MAYLLQGLILLAFANPFSHKLHLKMGLDCVKCHATAPQSVKAADNNLPVAETACKSCHPDGRTIKAPRRTLVTKFNHQHHVKLGSAAPVILAEIRSKTYFGPVTPELEARLTAGSRNACTACHRGLEANAKVDTSVFPHMADCLVCHTKIDPPFTCEKCHDEGPQLRPASHTPEFFDSHSSKKVEKIGCAICHGRKFTCQGCH